MKNCWVLLICCFISATTWSQAKPAFRSQNYLGLLEGKAGSAFQFQTVNGIQLGTWFAGAGVGLDWYLFRSAPLFLSLNKDFKAGPKTFYFSLDGGTNFSWEKRRSEWGEFSTSKFYPRWYGGFGLGYKSMFKNNKDAILINLGYSYKQMREKQTIPTYCINPPCPVTIEYYNYKTNRVSLRLGWQF